MSTLKALLNDVPVEWKALGDVTSVLRGRRLTKSQLISEGYPVFHGGLEPLGYYKDYNRNANSVMIINVGASAGNVGFSSNDFWSSDGCYCLAQVETINSRYLYYFLLGNEYYLKSKVRYAGIPTLDSAIIEKLQIPIPYPNDPEKSLAIQQEIVRVLDSLSEQNKALTSALAQGIDQRKKQYAYYREELFRFKGKEVEWKTLGEVAEKITSGGTPDTKKREYWENGTVPWMSSGEVNLETIYETEKFITVEGLNNSSAKYIPANSIVIALAGQGKTRGMVARTKIKLTTNQSLAAIIFDNVKFNTDYVFHYLKTQYKNLREISSGNGARGGLNLQMINKYKMPIPFPNDKDKSLQEQERIVRLLDQFDEATKNIVAQLEKEIELRNKQYEYYRNELLGFNG